MKLLICLSTAAALLGASDPEPSTPSLAPDEVLRRTVTADQARAATIGAYSSVRRYSLENKRFHKTAEIVARMNCDSSGQKTFEILSQHGPSILRERVLHRMLEAEQEASRRDIRPKTQIAPANYEFTFVRQDSLDDRKSYVFDIAPKTQSKFLMRGRIWVDAEEFAVTRVEGSPAQSPSVLIRNTQVTQQSAKVGSFWLPAWNHSATDSFLFGRTEVAIDYYGYEIHPSAVTPGGLQ
jgi:hypothetical protein